MCTYFGDTLYITLKLEKQISKDNEAHSSCIRVDPIRRNTHSFNTIHVYSRKERLRGLLIAARGKAENYIK
jgi:hypothetical protein